jgi:starch-binding outer membrane protein, SusD/RagB family
MRLKDILLKKAAFIILCGMALFVSCDEKLDIDPQQSIDADIALTTEQGLQTALIGAYERLQGGQLYGTNINLVSELLGATGDELQWAGTFLGYRELFTKNIQADNTEGTRTWIRAYDAINIANNILANVDQVVEEGATRDRIKGEALFLRGILHFELVRFYGLPWTAGNQTTNLGVPIMLEPTLSVTDAAQVSRATVAEVYTQVIDDLTTAKDLLPESNGTRADTYVASAFLARVYLQQADYENAEIEADRVIESGAYNLVPNYVNAFNNAANTSEDIFAIQQNAQSNAGSSNDGLATFYANFEGIGRGDVDISSTYVTNLYTAGDERLNIFYEDEDGVLRNGKYIDPFTNIPVIRLAEMYLIRAEASFRNGDPGQALEDINTIRNRANLPDLTAVTLADILLERERELAFEGFALHDAKRLMQTVGDLEFNSLDLVLPIPQREIDANPNLVQN